MGPAQPTPTPATGAPAASICSWQSATSATYSCSAPPRVGTSPRARMVPSRATTALAIFVPPMSSARTASLSVIAEDLSRCPPLHTAQRWLGHELINIVRCPPALSAPPSRLTEVVALVKTTQLRIGGCFSQPPRRAPPRARRTRPHAWALPRLGPVEQLVTRL